MDGEFNLGIDYIVVENNPYHKEETAYEIYKLPNFIASTYFKRKAMYWKIDKC